MVKTENCMDSMCVFHVCPVFVQLKYFHMHVLVQYSHVVFLPFFHYCAALVNSVSDNLLEALWVRVSIKLACLEQSFSLLVRPDIGLA